MGAGASTIHHSNAEENTFPSPEHRISSKPTRLSMEISVSTTSAQYKYTRCLNSIEKYCELAYKEGSKIDGVMLMLSTEDSYDAFFKFLELEYSCENLSFYSEVEALKHLDDPKWSERLQSLPEAYLRIGARQELNLSHGMRSTLLSLIESEYATNRETILSALEATQKEIVVIMAMGPFPRFIGSPLYKDWRKKEQLKCNTQSSWRAAISDDIEVSVTSLTQEPKKVNSSDFESWLTVLIAAVELVPISLVLFTARETNNRYPIVYANKYFGLLTMYRVKDIIGFTYDFLVRDGENCPTYKTVLNAFATASAITTSLHCRRKNGQVFKNLIALKPIFNEHGEYCYVIAVNMDVTSRGGSTSEVRVANELLRSLPDVTHCRKIGST